MVECSQQFCSPERKKMNALRALVLLVACCDALRSAVASSSVDLPAPHDICSGVDITWGFLVPNPMRCFLFNILRYVSIDHFV